MIPLGFIERARPRETSSRENVSVLKRAGIDKTMSIVVGPPNFLWLGGARPTRHATVCGCGNLRLSSE